MNQNTAYSVDFAEVRRQVPISYLFEFLLNGEPKLVPGAVRYHVCPNPQCGASKGKTGKVSVQDDRWRCFGCKEQGDVVEGASLFWGVSLREAGLMLLGLDQDAIRSYVPPKPTTPAVERNDAKLAEAIGKIVANAPKLDAAVVEYLAGRGIPESISQEAFQRKLMISLSSKPNRAKDFLFDVVGQELLIESGLMKQEAKAPACIFRPLIFISHGSQSAEFRLIRKAEEGEAKSLRHGGISPWAWQGHDSSRIMITEGCIDLLSAVALGTKRSIIALPGCENWRPEWFEKLKGRNVLLALDNDGPGRIAKEKLEPVLKTIGAEVGIYVPEGTAKDLNEELMSKLGLSK